LHTAIAATCQRTHERVTITKNGRPAAVLLSVEDLEGLEETLAIMSDPQAMTDIRQAQAQAQAELAGGEGETYTRVEALAIVKSRGTKA